MGDRIRYARGPAAFPPLVTYAPAAMIAADTSGESMGSWMEVPRTRLRRPRVDIKRRSVACSKSSCKGKVGRVASGRELLLAAAIHCKATKDSRTVNEKSSCIDYTNESGRPGRHPAKTRSAHRNPGSGNTVIAGEPRPMSVEIAVQLWHNQCQGDIALSNVERLVGRTRRPVHLAFNPPRDAAQ